MTAVKRKHRPACAYCGICQRWLPKRQMVTNSEIRSLMDNVIVCRFWKCRQHSDRQLRRSREHTAASIATWGGLDETTRARWIKETLGER